MSVSSIASERAAREIAVMFPEPTVVSVTKLK
jgi:hypothetical protein